MFSYDKKKQKTKQKETRTKSSGRVKNNWGDVLFSKPCLTTVSLSDKGFVGDSNLFFLQHVYRI